MCSVPPRARARNGRVKRLKALRGAIRALKGGDFGVRFTTPKNGVMKEIAAAFNDVAQTVDTTAREFFRVSKVVGRDGEMTERAMLTEAKGAWAQQVDAFNSL